MTFQPSIYLNQRPILTPDDLDNHPLAAEYIEYMRHMKFPPDFKTWLQRKENAREAKRIRDKMIVAAIAADPFCRSALKRRKI